MDREVRAGSVDEILATIRAAIAIHINVNEHASSGARRDKNTLAKVPIPNLQVVARGPGGSTNGIPFVTQAFHVLHLDHFVFVMAGLVVHSLRPLTTATAEVNEARDQGYRRPCDG